MLDPYKFLIFLLQWSNLWFTQGLTKTRTIDIYSIGNHKSSINPWNHNGPKVYIVGTSLDSSTLGSLKLWVQYIGGQQKVIETIIAL